MKHLILIVVILFSIGAKAQEKVYKGEREKINNLIHTKLKVDFNYEESQLNGEAWISLTPHFYPTNKLVLDAKAFLIHDLKINGTTATYNYSDDELTVELDRTYERGEQYEIYVKYTARPEQVRQKGSSAISSAKGLYFIDPKEEDDEI